MSSEASAQDLDGRRGIVLLHGAGKLGGPASWFQSRERLASGLRSGFVAAGKVRRELALDRPEEATPTSVVNLEYGPVLFERESHPPPSQSRQAPPPARSWVAQPKYRCLCCPTSRRYSTNARELTGAVARTGPATWPYIERRLPEVASYLTNPRTRKAVLGLVVGRLRETRPRVVVAHSLGSLVAVEALAHLDEEDEPELLVTLGSPMRLDSVYVKLNALTTAWPERRGSAWVNLHDRADVATGSKGLDHARFPGVINIAVSNGRHSHDAEHYLKHEVIGSLVWDVASGHTSAEVLRGGLRDEDLTRVRVKHPT